MGVPWEASLRRYLWDHLPEISPVSSKYESVFPSGVSNTWATGEGFEGFEGFRIEIRKFAGGQSNPTFLLLVFFSPPKAAVSLTHHVTSTGARNNTPLHFVLRKKPASFTVSSAHAIEREFMVLQALHATDVPVPRTFLFCEDSGVVGTPFYIMEFVNGRIFSDPSVPGVSPQHRAAVYASAVETLAKIHRLDFRRIGLSSFGRSKGGYFVRQIKTFAKIAHKQVRGTSVQPHALCKR